MATNSVLIVPPYHWIVYYKSLSDSNWSEIVLHTLTKYNVFMSMTWKYYYDYSHIVYYSKTQNTFLVKTKLNYNSGYILT